MPDNFKILSDKTKEIQKALRDLADSQVMVGIPDTADGRSAGAAIGNAALGYLHETGSPANNIPPRPFLQPGVNESKDKWLAYLKQAGELAMEGKASAVDKALHAAGITAVTAVKARITAGIPPPLKPATVAARQRRTKSRQANSAADVTPLIDTGQLLASITYVVRKGK